MNLNMMVISKEMKAPRSSPSNKTRLPSFRCLIAGQAAANVQEIFNDQTFMNTNNLKIHDDLNPSHKKIPQKVTYSRPTLPSHEPNANLNQDERKEMINHLKRRFEDFQSDPVFCTGTLNPYSTETGRITYHKRIKELNENPIKYYDESSYLPYDGVRTPFVEILKIHYQEQIAFKPLDHGQSFSNFDEVRCEALRENIRQNQLTSHHANVPGSQPFGASDNKENQPQASTSSIPHAARPQALNTLLPLTPQAGLSRGMIHGPVPQTFSASGYKGYKRPTGDDLIRVIQRVILVCCNPKCGCKPIVTNVTDTEEKSYPVYREIKDSLPNPSFYAPIPVFFQLESEPSWLYGWGSKLREGFDPPAFFDIYHGPIDCLIVGGLKRYAISTLIAYFTSPVRHRLRPQLKTSKKNNLFLS
ncbi:hypothetical protein DFH28DRAFT_1177798 [Melampsora americana]|nr:hypothetical protein DFH28DRAFT_1177798 [Melampsora americana]